MKNGVKETVIRPMTGTATLYHKISPNMYVIITAAHNFVQFEELAEKHDNDDIRYAKVSYFYFQCDGTNYKFKFKVLRSREYPKYYNSKTF